MAFDHENSHAFDFLLQFAMIGSSPHGATAGEEVAIIDEGFLHYFLDLWTIDNSLGSYRCEGFPSLFTNFGTATTAEQETASPASRCSTASASRESPATG